MAIKTWKHRRPWRLLIVLGLFMALFLLRGWIYRQLITYRSVGQRQGYTVQDEKLAMYLDQSIDGLAEPDIQELIHLGLSLTSQQLSFTADNNANDPNRLIHSKTAHCVGYAAFFATTCNYLLEKFNLSDTWTAKQQIGELYLFQKNLHQYFHSPFFKDHDFVTIEHKKTGEIIAVDPSVSDYFRIDLVRFDQD